MSLSHVMDVTPDDAALDAARTLGAMRNVRTSSKDSGYDGGDRNASYSGRLRGYLSGSSSADPPPLSHRPSSSSTRSSSSGSTSMSQEEDPRFMSRVSNMPFVGTALRVYEYGKASSGVVKYGAEMMEGTVKTVTKPVIDRLPVEQLDKFACTQLDRFGGGGRLGPSGRADDPNGPIESTSDSAPLSPHSPGTLPGQTPRGRKHLWIDDDGSTPRSSSRDSAASSGPPASDTAYSASSGAQTRYQSDSHWRDIVHGNQRQSQVATVSQPSSSQEVQVVSRSKWQAVLLEAGGIGAAVSEESMKRLKYCLQWLQYANHHIDQQIALLRSFIVSITPDNRTSSSTSTALVPFESLEILAQVKRELVNTIRQVVEVVSKYAGGALPEQARNSVRSFILMLPERWSSAARADDTAALRQDPSSGTGPDGRQGVSESAALVASTRVLSLATESLDMMRSITGIFKDSLDRAEAWVDRLQQLGLQRQQQQTRAMLADQPSDWPTSPAAGGYPTFDTSNYRSTQYPNRELTPSESASMASPPSTRAASDSGDDTETEAIDDPTSDAIARLRRRKRLASEERMDVDA